MPEKGEPSVWRVRPAFTSLKWVCPEGIIVTKVWVGLGVRIDEGWRRLMREMLHSEKSE